MRGHQQQVRKVLVRWRSQFPPCLAGGGFMVSFDGKFWEERPEEEVRRLANVEMVHWEG